MNESDSIINQQTVLFTRAANGHFNIFYHDQAQAVTEVLISNNFNNWNPQISPQRDLIAYASNQEINYQLHLADKSGNHIKKLSNLNLAGYFNNGRGIAWSPAGDQIVFSSFDRLFRVDTSGNQQELIARAPEGRHFRHCDWSVQGTIVIELTGDDWVDNELLVLNEDGSDPQIILYNMPGHIEDPVYSPDGERIVIVYDEAAESSNEPNYVDADLTLLDKTGQIIYNLSLNKPENTIDLQPNFSPDGEKIIFVNAPANDPDNKSIFIMDRDGNNRQKILDQGMMPSW